MGQSPDDTSAVDDAVMAGSIGFIICAIVGFFVYLICAKYCMKRRKYLRHVDLSLEMNAAEEPAPVTSSQEEAPPSLADENTKTWCRKLSTSSLERSVSFALHSSRVYYNPARRKPGSVRPETIVEAHSAMKGSRAASTVSSASDEGPERPASLCDRRPGTARRPEAMIRDHGESTSETSDNGDGVPSEPRLPACREDLDSNGESAAEVNASDAPTPAGEFQADLEVPAATDIAPTRAHDTDFPPPAAPPLQLPLLLSPHLPTNTRSSNGQLPKLMQSRSTSSSALGEIESGCKLQLNGVVATTGSEGEDTGRVDWLAVARESQAECLLGRNVSLIPDENFNEDTTQYEIEQRNLRHTLLLSQTESGTVPRREVNRDEEADLRSAIERSKQERSREDMEISMALQDSIKLGRHEVGDSDEYFLRALAASRAEAQEDEAIAEQELLHALAVSAAVAARPDAAEPTHTPSNSTPTSFQKSPMVNGASPRGHAVSRNRASVSRGHSNLPGLASDECPGSSSPTSMCSSRNPVVTATTAGRDTLIRKIAAIARSHSNLSNPLSDECPASSDTTPIGFQKSPMVNGGSPRAYALSRNRAAISRSHSNLSGPWSDDDPLPSDATPKGAPKAPAGNGMSSNSHALSRNRAPISRSHSNLSPPWSDDCPASSSTSVVARQEMFRRATSPSSPDNDKTEDKKSASLTPPVSSLPGTGNGKGGGMGNLNRTESGDPTD
eukprot:GEMP01014520.1.p1 GENE.GEMP01014520.1~~GEMP01014520.1.p1  ORF type:complete len:728 (+),score=174.14 GEMP01014520.1:251-2434(+)